MTGKSMNGKEKAPDLGTSRLIVLYSSQRVTPME